MHIILWAILAFTTNLSNLSGQDKINAPFQHQANPFFHALGLDAHHQSLNRDSTRIKLKDGHIDIILRNKKLWNISRYDRSGDRIGHGSFFNGTGVIQLTINGDSFEAEFENGYLEGNASKYEGQMRRPRYVYQFKEGLLDGKASIWSFWDARYVSIIEIYSIGYLTRSENYGRLRRWVGFLFMRPQVVDPEFLCSRTIYDRGRLISHECFVPKCRRCGA